MAFVLVVLSLSCFGLATWLVVTDVVVGRPERAALRRLRTYGRRADDGAIVGASSGIDLVTPLARITVRIAPGRDREQTTAQLQAAGIGAAQLDTFLALKSGLALVGALAGLVAGSGVGGLAIGLLFAVAGAGLGFVVPDVVVARRTRSRRGEILRELPNALDLLAVIVEAGLGLDAALARYAERGDGPLAQEIALLVAELRVGSARADAFRAFAARTPALETHTFVRAITAADQLGVSLSRTLRHQARDARLRRQLVAEQAANKAPVKMLFPTVLCIFPVMFVVVLGPAVLSLLHLG